MTGRRSGAVSRSRGVVLVLGGVLLALGLGSVGQGEAYAAAYRYWSFWERDGSAWAYATQGPSTARPADGEVQGFRFAVSRDSSDAAQPRGAADFASICRNTAARGGEKRVALVIDFGATADAPESETPPKARTACARVPDDATTAEALASVAKPLRYDTNALLCAIGGYPVRGCGEAVDSGAESETGTGSGAGSETETGTDSGVGSASGSDGRADTPGSSAGGAAGEGAGPSAGLFVGVGVVAALGGAAVWRARRRRG